MDINEFKTAILDFDPLANLQFEGYSSLNDCHRANFQDGKLQIFWYDNHWEVHLYRYYYWYFSTGETLAEAWESQDLRD